MKISGITKITIEQDYILEEYDLTPIEAEMGLKYVLQAGASVMLNQKNIVRPRSTYLELYSLTPDFKPLTRTQTLVFEIARPPSLERLQEIIAKFPYFTWYALTKFYTLTSDGSDMPNALWELVTGTDYKAQDQHVRDNLAEIHTIWKKLEKKGKAAKPAGTTLNIQGNKELLLDIAKVAYEEIDFLTIKHEMAISKPRIWIVGQEDEITKSIIQMDQYDHNGMYMVSRVSASVKNILSSVGPGAYHAKGVATGMEMENADSWIEKLEGQTILLSGYQQYIGYIPNELQTNPAKFMDLIITKGRMVSASDTGMIAVQLQKEEILGSILPQIIKSMFGSNDIYISVLNIA